jgi:serine/threonine-protein kinase
MARVGPRAARANSAPTIPDGQTAIPPQRLTDRYVLCSELGSGGMARVHVGRQLGSAEFTRTVAIKRLHPHFAQQPDFRLMLTDEARLSARVRHPNVVQMLDVVTTDDELFLVMEYIDGVSLGRLLRKARGRGERIPEAIVAAVIANVLQGLHAAHEATDERGTPLCIVHRDVSPDNVLVGVDGLARVLDFGVAKATSRLQSTQGGEIKGKLAYMAPEQLAGKATRQSDIFSASIILWEGLTGERLFRADDDGETIGKVLAGVVEPPQSIVPEIDPRLSEIVMRGLARAPADRWPTARNMALALEQDLTLATPSQVAAWVEEMDAAWLEQRRLLVRGVETMATDTAAGAAEISRVIIPATRSTPDVPPPVVSPDAVKAPAPNESTLTIRPPRNSRYAIALAVAVGVACATLIGWAARGRSMAAPSTETVVSAPPPEPAAPPPSPEPSTPTRIADSVDPPATSAPAAAPKTTRPPHRTSAPAGPAPSVRPPDKPNNPCDPPYRLGPMGEKIWLKTCL